METMKKRNVLQQVQHWADCLVERTVSRFSPVARVVFVLILGSALLLYSFFFIGHSIYNLGKRSVQTELIEQQQDDDNQSNQQIYEYN